MGFLGLLRFPGSYATRLVSSCREPAFMSLDSIIKLWVHFYVSDREYILLPAVFTRGAKTDVVDTICDSGLKNERLSGGSRWPALTAVQR